MRLDAEALRHAWIKFRFGDERRQAFYLDLRNAQKAGIAPMAAIARMRGISQGRRSLAWLVAILDDVLAQAREGRTLAQAFSRWVPPEDAALLAVGEQNSDLAGALEALDGLLTDKRKVRSALMSELVPTITMAVALVVLMVSIMSIIGPTVKDLLTPEIMATLDLMPTYIAIGEWVRHQGMFALVGLMAVVAVIGWSLPNWSPEQPARRWLDRHLPPYNFYARLQTAYFLISVSAMQRAGRTFRDALMLLRGFATPWQRAYLDEMLDTLRAGRPEVESMQVPMLPQDVADRINFYAILPNFADVLVRTSGDVMHSLLIRVKRIGSVVSFSMKIAMALFIVFTLASQYELSDGVEKATRQQSQGR